MRWLKFGNSTFTSARLWICRSLSRELRARNNMRLHCSECHHELELHAAAMECPRCAELLELVPDLSSYDPDDLKQRWIQRRTSSDQRDQSGVWRFREFLPEYPAERVVTLGEGNSPVVRGAKTA